MYCREGQLSALELGHVTSQLTVSSLPDGPVLALLWGESQAIDPVLSTNGGANCIIITTVNQDIQIVVGARIQEILIVASHVFVDLHVVIVDRTRAIGPHNVALHMKSCLNIGSVQVLGKVIILAWRILLLSRETEGCLAFGGKVVKGVMQKGTSLAAENDGIAWVTQTDGVVEGVGIQVADLASDLEEQVLAGLHIADLALIHALVLEALPHGLWENLVAPVGVHHGGGDGVRSGGGVAQSEALEVQVGVGSRGVHVNDHFGEGWQVVTSVRLTRQVESRVLKMGETQNKRLDQIEIIQSGRGVVSSVISLGISSSGVRKPNSAWLLNVDHVGVAIPGKLVLGERQVLALGQEETLLCESTEKTGASRATVKLSDKKGQGDS